jgi:hypothetical protein
MKNPLAPSSSYHRVISKVIGRKISYLDISEEAREGMKEMGMNDWLIDVIMDGFNYIISGKYGSQTTNVIEKVTGRKLLKLVRLIEHSHLFLLYKKSLGICDWRQLAIWVGLIMVVCLY